MYDNGLEIKNISAGSLFEYNQGVRSDYKWIKAMFNKSLFSNFLLNNGMNVWKDKNTRDIICLDFDFGSRTFEAELEHINKLIENNNDKIKLFRLKEIKDNIIKNKNNYIEKSSEEIRELFYKNGVSVEYLTRNKKGEIIKRDVVKYKMLYRTSAKAKLGQVCFINENLYDISYDWLTMGIGSKMPFEDAKIVEMSAYAPLTTSTIVDDIYIPVEDILILKDQDSFFRTFAKVVKAKEYKKNKNSNNKQSISKMCIVEDSAVDIKNTLWDGMGLIDDSLFPEWGNGMLLLRNHFFKMCGFRSNIQLFFKDWCAKNNKDYDTYEVLDMFGVKHKLKDIKVITTDNAIKWKKFSYLMGESLKEAYYYWCNRINQDNSIFGIVKTDHPSKLGNYQQLSYQMINTLPCSQDDIDFLAKDSISYIEMIKKNNDEFIKFLINNATEVNHYKMLADLLKHNYNISKTDWFRNEKKAIIQNYTDKLRKGKIFVDGDNLTACGNPYALLLHSVGEDWRNDSTLKKEKGVIQCFTKRFKNQEYLCGIRNPHNSPNNVCYFKNVYSNEMLRYFPFSENIIALNCIETDVQARLNGCDFDADFLLVTRNESMVKAAKICYYEYPTIVNDLKESGITYSNTMKSYSDMDNKFAKSSLGIGWSSNLAQLALTYYWTSPTRELYDNFVILSVLAQIIIDGCKREYEVDGLEEIKRIKSMDCMNRTLKYIDLNGNVCYEKKDYPYFMKYTKEIKTMKNGKEIEFDKIQKDRQKILKRIDNSLVCPMNMLQNSLSKIKKIRDGDVLLIKDFIIPRTGTSNKRQTSKIKTLVDKYSIMIKEKIWSDDENNAIMLYNELVEQVLKIKISNKDTIRSLIDLSMNVKSSSKNKKVKNKRLLLNILYKTNKTKFLSCFEK